jgi:hypothetical protein
MIRNNQHRRVRVARAVFPQLGSQSRNAVAGATERRFSTLSPSENSIAIPVKVFDFTTDRGLIAIGVAAAIGSMVFAIIMISQNSRPDIPKEVEHPEIFARALHYQYSQSQVHVNNRQDQLINTRTIDYNVTGSIFVGSAGKSMQNTTPVSNSDGSVVFTDGSTNNTYLLRFVHKETALLQSEHGFYVARRGTILPGAGKVLSIERFGNTWTLVTATRIFTEVR